MTVPSTDVKDLHEDTVLLDVREQDEWDAGHAIEAVHIPLAELPDRVGELPDAADGPVYVVCRSGRRSERAAQYLAGLGYEAVNVTGGMQAWHAAGKPMMSDNGQDPRVA